MKKKLRGVFAALLTPFDEPGRVDEKRLRALVGFLVDRGIHGLYVCGSTGEGILQSVAERKRVAEIVRDACPKKVCLIAHVGGAGSTAGSVELARHAERAGYDVVSSIPPIYYPFSYAEVFAYYQALAESTALPFLIYYIPSASGVSLPVENIVKLGSIKNVVGLKYTAPDMYVLQRILQETGNQWIALSGPDEGFLPALVMGAAGCIGATQNVLPEIFLGIYEHFQAGRIREAMALQARISQAVALILRHGRITAWKHALGLRGIDAGFPREPFARSLAPSAAREFDAEWRRLFPEYTGA